MNGRVVHLRRGGACGYIRTGDGNNVFFHASDLDGMTYDDLQDQLAVSFTLIPDEISGPRAIGIRPTRPAARRRA